MIERASTYYFKYRPTVHIKLRPFKYSQMEWIISDYYEQLLC